MPAQAIYDEPDYARDLRNVMLSGILSVLALSMLAIVGVPTRILNIPLAPNMLVAGAGLVVALLGLLGLQLKWPLREIAWDTMAAWTVVITLAIHFTGGPQTPMPALYVLLAVAASFLLGRRDALVLALFGLASYALVLALEYTNLLPIVQIWNMPFEPRGRELLLIVNLITVAAPTLVAALLAGTQTERLTERNRQSNELRQQALERLSSVQQANRQMRALQISLSTFQSVLELDETFKRIATAVCGLGYTMAYIATYDEQHDCLRVGASVTTLPAETVKATEALSSQPLASATFTRADSDNIGVRAFLSGDMLTTQNLYDFYRPLVTEEVAGQIAQMIKFGCGASMPLRVEGRPVGNLFALTSRPTLSEADLILLQAFADQAGVALERAQLFAQVRRGRDHLQAVLNSTLDGIVMVDQGRCLTVANPAAISWLDMEAGQLEGATLDDVLARLGQRAGLDEAALQALQTEFAGQCNTSMRHTFDIAGPPRRCLELVCWPVSGQAANEAGMLMVLHDITHQKELEASREEMTHMLVHDLRGPLSSTIAGLYLARDMVHIDTDTTVKSMGLALDSAERLLELINSLLDIYKLEAGGLPFELSQVDLAKLIPESIKPFESTAQGDAIELLSQVEVGLPTVTADAGAIQRVLSNLVDNALKFTPQGGRVLVRAQSLEGVTHVSVADSGPGIPIEVRSHIFEKFSQVKGQKGKRRGTGLGLTYCKLTIEAHGGRIWVDCPPQGGSVFTFVLPHNESPNP